MATLSETFTNIANAIRSKLGSSATYTPTQMPNAILEITTGTDTTDATASQSEILNGKTAYISSGKVTGSMENRGTVTATLGPGASYTILGGYYNSGTVSARTLLTQTKTEVITPSANWSGENTNTSTISKDSNYDGMTSVTISTPMLRDNTLLTASVVDTPSTVYNGNTSQSNSEKMLRVAPTKTGMGYTNSYLYLPKNSLLGNATADDVASGKTFSSEAGIQVTGTKTTSLTEYILWTNDSPSSDYDSNTSWKYFSESISNFRYIRFEYKYYKTDQVTRSCIFTLSDLLDYYQSAANYSKSEIGMTNNAPSGFSLSSYATYSRSIEINYSSFCINSCLIMGHYYGTDRTITDKTVNNSYIIPIKIYGVERISS